MNHVAHPTAAPSDGRGAHALARPTGMLGQLAVWWTYRPTLGTESVLLCASIYFVLACNGPFWQALMGRSAGSAASQSMHPMVYGLAVGTALTALQFALLALLAHRWFLKPLVTALILVATISSYFSARYGVYLDPGMLRNVLETDAAEARELLSLGLFAQLALVALPAVVLLQRVQLRQRGFGRALGIRLGSMVAGVLIGVAALGGVFKDFAGQMRLHKEMRYLIAPASAVYSMARVLSRDGHAARLARAPVGTDAHQGTSWARARKPLLFVMVVGETARSLNWGLNAGAPHNTTPELARRTVINFAQITSCGTNTEVSVPCLFSPQGRRHYDEEAIRGSESLLHVLARTGLRVVWTDNQSGCKGVCDGLENTRPNPARLPALCDGERCLDEALLHSAQQLLQDHTGNLVLVLHQLGNHGPAYFKRYPASFRQFTPACELEDLAGCSQQELVNAYDNALRYTDHVLAQTIDWLASLEAQYDTALLYVSDHGESLGENGLFLHGIPYAIAPDEQTHVPMVMWFSKGYASRTGLDTTCLGQRALQPASHDHVFHSVLGLLDIETTVRDPALDLSAHCRH